MELTEKWLGEIGGWQAMKAARGLVDGGFVTLQSAETGRVRGLAGAGKTKFACGLAFTSRTDVTNLCTCPASRRGLICEHSLAVVLAHLRGGAGPAASSQGRALTSTPTSVGSNASLRSAQPSTGPQARALASAPTPATQPLRVPGFYTLYLPENLLTGQMREPVGVYVRYNPNDKEPEESLLAAWLAEKGVKGQSVPLSLPAAALDDFFRAAAEHPRVIAGKPNGGGSPLSIAREPVRLLLTAESRPGEKDVTFRLASEDQRPLFPQRPTAAWFCRETQSLFPVPKLTSEAEQLLRELPAKRPLKWLIQHREALNDAFQLELRGSGLEHFHCAPVPCRFTLHLEGSLQAVEATLRADFGGKEWLVGESGPRCAAETLFPFEDSTTPGLFYLRNEAEEARLMALMESLGFQISMKVEASGHRLVWKLTKPESVLELYATELPRLRREMKVIEGERWRAATRGVARIAPQIHRREGENEGRSGGGRTGWPWSSPTRPLMASACHVPRFSASSAVASAASRRRMASATCSTSPVSKNLKTRCVTCRSSSPRMVPASAACMPTTSWGRGHHACEAHRRSCPLCEVGRSWAQAAALPTFRHALACDPRRKRSRRRPW